MSSVGSISLDLNVNSRNFNKQVNGIQRQTTKAFGTMSVAVGNIMANLATKAVESVGNFVKDSIDKGSELAELQNVVDSVFTTMSDKVETFSQNALAAYGLTEGQSKKMIGTYGAMAKSFGYTESQAYNMSAALTGLTGDVASFYNLNHDEAYTKLKSVFTGETESLKELGVVMTQTALDEFALANGFGKTTAKMSEQEKVALRLAFVQDKLATASGDFARTQNQWANQTRILSGQFESLKASIGQGLINILTPVIKVINTIMAKLVQLANAFKSFTEMITGKKSSSGVGDAMKGVAESADNAATSTGGIEKAADGAAKAAKKAQKSLMGFDEVNKLQNIDDSSSDSGGGSSSSFDGIDFSGAVEEQEKKTNEAISSIMSKMKELVGEFKKGFSEGLGADFENSLKRIKTHVTNIGTSLKGIFNDPEVKNAASKWAKSVAKSLGQITGSVVSIGTSIAENLVGGVDKYLTQNAPYIKSKIVGILDASSQMWQKAGELSVAVASIFEVVRGEDAKQITADIIGIVANSLLGITELATKMGADIMNLISKPIIDNKDKIKKALQNALQPIKSVLSTLNTSVKETFGKISQVYDEKISPMFQSFASGISSIVGKLLDAYNTYIAPVLTQLGEKFSSTWKSKIQPTINKAITLIGKVATLIKTLWEKVLQPLISWIVSNVVPKIAPILKQVGSLFITLFGTISKVVGNIFDVLGGLCDFITGVFKGDWTSAWNGIKAIFISIWNAIKSFLSLTWEAIKGIVSAAVNSIKTVISVAFNAIKTIVTTIWNAIKEVLLSVWNGIKEAASTVWNCIKNTITTIVTGIKTSVITAWNTVKTSVTTVMTAIKTTAKNIWTAIKTTVTTLVNGIKTGVITAFTTVKTKIASIMESIKNSFKSAWNNIWSFLKGILNNIIGGAEKMINGLIKAINGMVTALNKLSFNAPDWVPGIGGKKFGFDLKKVNQVSLPRLAQGGYVKANQPQPVIVGDNKTQGEIIAPEGKMLSVMLEALETFFSRLQQSGYRASTADGVGDIVIPIYLDGSLLDEVIVSAQQRRNIRSGGR